jgi:hypothetical protein
MTPARAFWAEVVRAEARAREMTTAEFTARTAEQYTCISRLCVEPESYHLRSIYCCAARRARTGNPHADMTLDGMLPRLSFDGRR